MAMSRFKGVHIIVGIVCVIHLQFYQEVLSMPQQGGRRNNDDTKLTDKSQDPQNRQTPGSAGNNNEKQGKSPILDALSGKNGRDTKSDNGSSDVDTGNKRNGPCDLYTTDPDIYSKITNEVNGGAKLLEYELDFPEYKTNPLLINMSHNFLSHKWSRAITSHGKTLLALGFNYKVLSLSMLSFGVAKVKVGLIDAPRGCFGEYNAEEKMQKILKLVLSDFKLPNVKRAWVGEIDYACHQVATEDKYLVAHFKYVCCEKSNEGHSIHCIEDMSVKWISIMFFLVVILKIIAFLTGPVFLNRVVYSESLKQADYIVKLKDAMRKTILVKKIKSVADNSTSYGSERKDFSKFKRVVKAVKPECVNYVVFRKLQLRIDHRQLMTEKSVPVGLFLFLYENIFRCHFLRWEPFYTCCKESIFGSWSPYFLWIKLRKQSECNTTCRKYCSWARIFRFIGGVLLLISIPIPYYIRVAIYYAYEEEEVLARKKIIKELDLDYPWENTLIHYFEPNHPVMLLLYCTYAISFALLVAFRAGNASKFDPIAVGAVHDMRSIKRLECLRLLLAHLVLPFEKFGICGILIGLLYWPIVIPICLFICICYCIPTLYLLGRFLVQKRPSFLRNTPRPTSPNHFARHNKKRHTLSKGTSSFETCFLIEAISPENAPTQEEKYFPCSYNNCKRFMNQCCGNIVALFVGLLCCVFMLSVLILFADVLGFLVEIFVFSLMGAVVNASSAAKFLMLAFWIMVYSSSCFNNVYDRYTELNEKLFSFIKDKLKDEIKEVTQLRDEKQKNTAFKFFNVQDLLQMKNLEIEEEIDSDIVSEGARDEMQKNYRGYGSENDSIEYINNHLHWRVHSLIFFVDNEDEPRIPVDLFHEICKIEAPGCPGPIHRGLTEAFKQLSYMIIFILFVVITVMAFGDAYKISSTNQLMVTLAGGFLPFVVRFVIKPKASSVDLSSYSFEGKIHQVIYKFKQAWPVYDLSFRVESCEAVPQPPPRPEGEEGGNGEGDGENDLPPALPTHVDLLITIRDDMETDDNINQETGPIESRDQAVGPDTDVRNPDRGRWGLSMPTFTSFGTQTGPDDHRSLISRSYGPYSSYRTQYYTPTSPVSPPEPVDLMVDMHRGGFRVRNQTTQYGAPEQGKVIYGRGSPYRRVPSVSTRESGV